MVKLGLLSGHLRHIFNDMNLCGETLSLFQYQNPSLSFKSMLINVIALPWLIIRQCSLNILTRFSLISGNYMLKNVVIPHKRDRYPFSYTSNWHVEDQKKIRESYNQSR